MIIISAKMAGATGESHTERWPTLCSLDILSGYCERRSALPSDLNISSFAGNRAPSFSPLTIAPVPAIF
jgi:hypothetical protein